MVIIHQVDWIGNLLRNWECSRSLSFLFYTANTHLNHLSHFFINWSLIAILTCEDVGEYLHKHSMLSKTQVKLATLQFDCPLHFSLFLRKPVPFSKWALLVWGQKINILNWVLQYKICSDNLARYLQDLYIHDRTRYENRWRSQC